MLNSLPDEVFFEILSRLPVKTIIRSRCVCKTWCSLISSPQFIATHLNRSLSNPENPPYLLFRHFDDRLDKARLTLHSSDVPFFSNSFTELHSSHQNIDKFRIVAGSSNGVLCLAKCVRGPIRDPYVLWNPSIRKVVTLPNPDVGIIPRRQYYTSVGFGYVPKADDYKLVRLVFRLCDLQFGEALGIAHWVQIYTLRTHAWRTVTVHGPPYHMKRDISTAFFHGAIHWPARVERHRGEWHRVIVSFDLANEVFGEVGIPESLQKANDNDVAVLDGFIALVHNPDRWPESKSVWVMKEYGVVKSWTKLFDITIDYGVSAYIRVIRVIGFKETGEVLMEVMGHLFLYEPSSQRLVSLHVYGRQRSFFLDKYVESLVLLNVPNTVLPEPT